MKNINQNPPNKLSGLIKNKYGDFQKLQDALAQSEIKYKTTINALDEAIYVIDSDFKIVLLNKKMEKLCKEFEIPKDIIGKNFEVISIFEKNTKEEYKTIFETGNIKSKEEHIRKDEKEFVFETKKIPILENNEVKQIITLIRDVTERKKIEIALNESQKLYSSIVEENNDGIIITQNNYLKFVNSKFLEITGFSKENVINKSFFEFVDSKYKKLVEKNYNKRLVGKKAAEKYEIELVSKKGKIPVEINSSLIQYKNKIAIMATLRDVSHRRELEEKLKKSVYELKRLDQMKSDFLSMVAHEFRTPLTIINSYTQVIKKECEKNKEHKRYLENILREMDHLNNIINKLIQVSKIESGKMILHKTKFNVGDLVKEVYTSIFSVCKKNHNVKLNIKDVKIEADKILIKTLISNLVSNAHKYTPKGGKIEINLDQNSKFIQFKITDEGVGIKKEDQEKLFKLFSIMDTGLKRDSDRLGIGLFTCKKIVELHKGKIWCESEKDKGSSFYFRIPK